MEEQQKQRQQEQSQPEKPRTDNRGNDKNVLGLNSSFLLHNGFDIQKINSDIEMITIQSVTYTSLKDILPSSPPCAISPTHNSSWCEIPIKNPLVKQAALAYLQPMSTPHEVGEKGFFGRLKEWCCGEGSNCGCLAWLNDIVLKSFRGRGSDQDDDEEDDQDDDEEEVY